MCEQVLNFLSKLSQLFGVTQKIPIFKKIILNFSIPLTKACQHMLSSTLKSISNNIPTKTPSSFPLQRNHNLGFSSPKKPVSIREKPNGHFSDCHKFSGASTGHVKHFCECDQRPLFNARLLPLFSNRFYGQIVSPMISLSLLVFCFCFIGRTIVWREGILTLFWNCKEFL